MWQLVNKTPFAAERAFTRNKSGAEVWIVAVKGTFLINEDGTNRLSDEQEDVNLGPQYYGEPGKTGLLYDSDMLPEKPGTDVILHGHAYSPRNKLSDRVNVVLRIGNTVKALAVFGDRFWESGLFGLKLTDPVPFSKIPIVYERAFGGVDQKSKNPKEHNWEKRNPVGRGFAVKAEHLIGQPLPNIEYPDQLIHSWKDRPNPASFTPVACDWHPRVGYAGTYDKKWEYERQPLLPDDFNEKYYHSAPEDQQFSSYLEGGESVELLNLSPEGKMRFKLPDAGKYLSFITDFGENTLEHEAKLHTVILEPDARKIKMVWVTSINCHNKEHKLKKTTVEI